MISRKKLSYESMKDDGLAKSDIRDYMVFLGAADIAFEVANECKCSLSYSFGHETFVLEADAAAYVEAWFLYESWSRAKPARPRFNNCEETQLALINFWYLLRDRWMASCGPLLYRQAQALKAAHGLAVHAIQKARFTKKNF